MYTVNLKSLKTVTLFLLHTIFLQSTLVSNTFANPNSNLAQNIASKQADLSMYPQAAKGYIQKIVVLPPKAHEENFKVELVTLMPNQTTDCNRRNMIGEMEEKFIDGWGYSYFYLSQIQMGPTTLMLCPEPAKKATLPIVTTQQLINYNSKLPIVVYTPENTLLKYRMWQAGQPLQPKIIKITNTTTAK